MIEVQRSSPTRILKQRDVLAAGAVRSEAPQIGTAPARSPSPSPVVPPRCTTKEARLVAVGGGAHAVEVRCSCGEWTRVEIQVDGDREVSR